MTIDFPVLPGDSVFMLHPISKIDKWIVSKIEVLHNGDYIMRIYRLTGAGFQYYEAVCPFEFGKTIFLTMEEAISALNEKKDS